MATQGEEGWMQHMRQRIRVAIHSADLLSAAGAAAALRGQEAFEVVPVSEDSSGTVALLVGWQVDDRLLARCRRLVQLEGARVVLIVGRIGEAEIRQVINHGVGTVLLRHEASAPRLAAAILAAHRGEEVLPPDLGRWNRGGHHDRMWAPGRGLSEREVEVLRLIAEGLDTREIAHRICYSERTVKYVLQGAMQRLHLRSRAHAVAFACREGYL
jgi:DNA-binding NarL/FixJ family response regulator